MNIAAIIAVIATGLSYVPKLIEIGEDVAPFLTEARTAITALQSGGQITDEQFADLDAKIKPLEDQLQALAAGADTGTADTGAAS